MKHTRRSFTLVEMLIVIVIIGILAAALIPRLQAVQSRARDTKRKSDVVQIGSALSVYKSDVNSFSPFSGANDTSDITIALALSGSYMTVVPTDSYNTSTWRAGTGNWANVTGYAFATLKRNGLANTAIGIMAKTETDGVSSNWVVATGAFVTGALASGNDAATYEGVLCSRVAYGTVTTVGTTQGAVCSAIKTEDALRYFYLQ